MRINGFGATGIDEQRTSAKTDSAGQPATVAKGSGQESVVVSSATQQISAAVAQQSAARSERVASVRAQVQSGTYQVDKDKLAERLADDELARAWK